MRDGVRDVECVLRNVECGEFVWESLCGWVGFGSRGKNVV